MIRFLFHVNELKTFSVYFTAKQGLCVSRRWVEKTNKPVSHSRFISQLAIVIRETTHLSILDYWSIFELEQSTPMFKCGVSAHHAISFRTTLSWLAVGFLSLRPSLKCAQLLWLFLTTQSAFIHSKPLIWSRSRVCAFQIRFSDIDQSIRQETECCFSRFADPVLRVLHGMAFVVNQMCDETPFIFLR